MLATLLGLIALAPAEAGNSSFDHFTTGFELLGLHREVPCEACHVGGIFKGTPSDCFSCHVQGSRIGASAKPTTHIISSNDCSQCHTPFGWKPVAHFNHLNVIGNCSSCHNTVQSTGKPANHVPTTADCSSCHVVNQPWTKLNFPANHIPTSPTSSCSNCHTGSTFSVVPSLTNIHLYAPSTSANCAQCHGSAAPSFAIPAIGFAVKGVPLGHIPLAANGACESCHVGAASSIAATPVVDSAKFTGSAMNHAGVTTCVGCHGPTVSGTTFYGVTAIIVMPPSAPVGPSSHIPSSMACEGCHAASMPSGQIPANSTKTVPGSLFATPAPTTAQIHAGISSGCAACHEGGYQWVDVTSQYPLNPATLGVATTQYMGFQTRPGPTASATNLVDAPHPATGDCSSSSCHGTNVNFFSGQLKPSNHIPTSATAQCTNCHTSADFSVMPTLLNIHTYAPSTTSNCAQCHGSAVAAGFAIPAANFSIVTTPSNHIPTTAACESCHVGAGSSVPATPVPNGSKFTGSAMSHVGITTGCAACHGPTISGATFYGITSVVVMPPSSPAGASSHIPSGTTCETCHLGSAPAAFVPANSTKTAPGTLFATPIPTTAQIHTGITTGCASCHESNDLWMDMANYPISPTVLTTGAQYTGFNTRPVAAASTYGVADGAHPATGDCSTCHTGTAFFSGQVKPSNHIPTSATAQCTNCHTSADFSVMPTLLNIHTYAPSTTSNCAQCHGSAVAAGFAIPAANFSIVTTPSNHIPTTAACESCHVGAGSSVPATPVPNGSKFTGSAMSHVGITTGCAACHGPTISGATFYGITSVVVMPPSSPAGASSHIPSGTTCETCHLGSAPAAFVPANSTKTAPGTLFATPIPTTAQIHTGITTGCSGCHESNYVWMDMADYPISPAVVTTGAQYTGFDTRPGAVASTYGIADALHPATGDCSQCHSGTSYWSAQAEPSNHIPTLPGAVCSTCHTTAGNFAVYTSDLTTLHTEVSTACSTCHANGKGPFAGATGFAIVQMSTRGVHIPITNAGVPVECSGCHKSVTTFTGTVMSHSAIGDNANSTAGNACDACHEYGFRSEFYGVSISFTRNSATHHICGSPGTPTAPNVTVCATGGGSDCLVGCHQHNNIPATYAAARKPGFQTKPASGAAATGTAATILAPSPPAGVGAGRAAGPAGAPSGRMPTIFDHSSLAGQSCQSCHNSTLAAGKGSGHPLTTTACGDCHSTTAWQPVLRVDHADVIATCASCHNGLAAAGLPAQHPAAGIDCDRCHTTSAWKPAAFDHKAVLAGSCATCHNGLQAAGKRAAHVLTTLSCDSCHYVLGWQPVKPAAPPVKKAVTRPALPPRGPVLPVPATPQ